MTKLNSSLPKGDRNGLEAVNWTFIHNPAGTILVVAVLDCKEITTNTDTGEQVATARVRTIQPIDPDDKATAERLLRRGLERRLGKTMLPIDLEDEIDRLLDSIDFRVDPDTGEISDTEKDPDVSDPDDVEDPPAPTPPPWDDPEVDPGTTEQEPQ